MKINLDGSGQEEEISSVLITHNGAISHIRKRKKLNIYDVKSKQKILECEVTTAMIQLKAITRIKQKAISQMKAEETTNLVHDQSKIFFRYIEDVEVDRSYN